jgi:hypothetical protein
MLPLSTCWRNSGLLSTCMQERQAGVGQHLGSSQVGGAAKLQQAHQQAYHIANICVSLSLSVSFLLIGEPNQHLAQPHGSTELLFACCTGLP